MTLRGATDLRVVGAAACLAPLVLVSQALAQVPPTLTLTPERVGGRSATVLTGQQWRVRGVVQPYVPNQLVTVRFYRGRSKLRVKQVAVLPSSTGAAGYFLVSFRTSKPGRVTVRASHLATPQLPDAGRPGAQCARARAPSATRLARPGRPSAPAPLGRQAVRRQRQRRVRRPHRARGTGLPQARGSAPRGHGEPRGLPQARARAGAFPVRFPSHGRHVEAGSPGRCWR